MSFEGDSLVSFIDVNYQHFSSLSGSQHIASRSSALNLLELLRIFRPTCVLDWGSGIGTLIPLYDVVNTSTIVAVEKDEWCRSQFIKNTQMFSNIFLRDDLTYEFTYDFVVIDDSINLKTILRLISRNLFPQVVFIEGWRNRTIAKISFVILLRGMSADFARGNDRSLEFRQGEREKSGAYFVLSNENLYSSISSWTRRCLKTHEIREFRNFLMKNLGLFRVLSFLKLGAKLRSIFKLSKKQREKYWKREL